MDCKEPVSTEKDSERHRKIQTVTVKNADSKSKRSECKRTGQRGGKIPRYKEKKTT